MKLSGFHGLKTAWIPVVFGLFLNGNAAGQSMSTPAPNPLPESHLATPTNTAGGNPATNGWVALNPTASGGTTKATPPNADATLTIPPTGAETAPIPAGMPSLPLPSGGVSEKDLTDLLSRIKADASIPEAVQSQVLQILNRALEQARQSVLKANEAARLEESTLKAPAMLEQIRRELAAPAEDLQLSIPADATLDTLQQRVTQVEAELANAQQELERLDAAPKQRTQRETEVVAALAKAKSDLQSLVQEITATSMEGAATNLVVRASRIEAQARKQALESTILAYQKELDNLLATKELIAAQRERALRQVNRLKKQVDFWRNALNERRRKESEQAARKAEEERRRALILRFPILSELAETNAVLANLRAGENGLTARIEEAGRQLKEIETHIAKVQEAFRMAQRRIETVENAGLHVSDAIGLILRRERRNLPDLRRHRSEIAARQVEISKVQLSLMETEDEQRKVEDTDLETLVAEKFRELDRSVEDWQQEYLERELRRLFQARKEILDGLINDYEAYFEVLTKVNERQVRLMEVANAFKEFIDERVLWIRSMPRLSTGDFRTLARPEWLGSFASQLRAAVHALANDFLFFPYLHLPALGIIGFFWARSGVYRRRIREHGDIAEKKRNLLFTPTILTLIYTLLLALPGPVLLVWLGWRLSEAAVASGDFQASSMAFYYAAFAWFTMGLVRHTCRPRGLAECHFDWSLAQLRLVRRHLNWLMPILIPLLFFLIFAQSGDTQNEQQLPPGRIIFIAGLLVVAWFGHLVCHFERGLASLRPKYSLSLYFLSLIAPLFPAVAAGMGYYYTALKINWNAADTLWLLFGVFVGQAIVMRWLLLARRRLAFEQARKKREALLKEADSAGREVETMPVEEENLVNIAEVQAQTTRLTRTVAWVIVIFGLWGIWADLLPALRFLDDIPVGSFSAKSASVTPAVAPESSLAATPFPEPNTIAASTPLDPTADTADSVSPSPTPGTPASAFPVPRISWWDLIFAVVVLIITVAASRNIPGFLEVTLLRRLDLQPGGGYAITTLVRYFIWLTGIIIIGDALGLTWSKIQWLAAAITLGVGFGLQEIIANFISGIILLFERPIRVGDVVTVGDVTGLVSKIRIRATTITNWERQEYVVPNKEFITGRILNWTLSNPINRVVVKVGIAYGSDTEKARSILFKIAKETPTILEDPAPMVNFEEFGDSALLIVMRCYLPNLDNRLATINELHTRIHQQFNAAGIEIAFPQTDLHIRSIPQEWKGNSPVSVQEFSTSLPAPTKS